MKAQARGQYRDRYQLIFVQVSGGRERRMQPEPSLPVPADPIEAQRDDGAEGHPDSSLGAATNFAEIMPREAIF